MLLEREENVEGELAEKGKVVGGVDDEGAAARGGGELLHVGRGADGSEELANLVLSEAGVFEGLADVAGGLAGPDDVAEASGGVIEGADLEAGVVGGGNEGVAGAKGGAEDAELLVALGLEPVEAGTDVDDGLLAGGDRAADVGADGVVGAFELGGAADVVVGLGEAEGGDAETVEESAKGVVREGVGVPLRHNDDGLLRPAGLGFGGVCGIPAGVDDVVFGVTGGDGGGEAKEGGVLDFAGVGFAVPFCVLREGFGADVGGEEERRAIFETEVGGGFVGEEAFGVRGEVLVEGGHALEVGLGEGGLGEAGEPVEAPLERTDEAVCVAGGEGGFPSEHPLRVELVQHGFQFSNVRVPERRAQSGVVRSAEEAGGKQAALDAGPSTSLRSG